LVTAKETIQPILQDWGVFADQNRQTGGGGRPDAAACAAPELKHWFNPL
jgi:hypothetical protein